VCTNGILASDSTAPPVLSVAFVLLLYWSRIISVWEKGGMYID